MNKLIKFQFKNESIKKIRQSLANDFERLSDYFVKKDKNGKIINNWNQYITILLKIDETLYFINSLKFPKYKKHPQAFDLYELILHTDVVIDSISILAKMFDVKKDSIISKNDCFGDSVYLWGTKDEESKAIKNVEGANDYKFWKYIRSLTTTHPTNTYKSNFLENEPENYLHNSPYAMWNIDKKSSFLINVPNHNIIVKVWRGDATNLGAYLTFDTSMIKNYVNKWIELLKVIELKKNSIIVNKVEQLKNTKINTIEYYDYNWDNYLTNLYNEYKIRYDKYGCNDYVKFLFTKYIPRVLKTNFSDKFKQKVLNRYVENLKNMIIKFHYNLEEMDEEKLNVFEVSYIFENYKELTKDADLNYEFEKINYLNNWVIENPNEEYIITNKIKDMLKQVNNINKLPLEESIVLIKKLDIKQPCSDQEWGRVMAIRINELLLKEWFPINIELNDWKVYLQIVLAFFYKSKFYKGD